MQRKIVTISREAGAYGHELVEILRQRFGLAVVDEVTLPKQKGKYGIPDFPLEHFDEKTPSLWESFSLGKERYLSFLKTAIFDLAVAQDLVISGHGGVFVMDGVPGVLNLRLIADEERRIAVLQSRSESSHEQARRNMHHIDRLRRGFNRFFFDADWQAGEHYHMVLNMGLLSVEQVAKMIELYWQNSPDNDATLTTLKDRLLQERVVITILHQEGLAVDLLEVKAEQGRVELRGIVAAKSIATRCEEVTQAIDDVSEVVNSLRVVDSSISYLMTI